DLGNARRHFAADHAERQLPGCARPHPPDGGLVPDRTDARGSDAALARDGRPFPPVIFGHALGSYNTPSAFLTTHLASHATSWRPPRSHSPASARRAGRRLPTSWRRRAT